MNIAIIGAGNVGGALAASLTRAGHRVTISARSAESARRAAAATGATPAESNREAVAGSAVVILAVWFANLEDVARELGGSVDGKIIIDVSNPMGANGELVTQGGPSAAELLQGWLPAARVVKAFNTVFASIQREPRVHSLPADAFVAADDEQARAGVLELVGSIGLRAIDAGPLQRARQLEALGNLNIALNMTHGWNWNSAWKLLGAPVEEPSAADESPALAGSHR